MSPTYVYETCECEILESCPCQEEVPDEFELNVPVEERDRQWCQHCGMMLKRLLRFEGLVWAPTAGGMR